MSSLSLDAPLHGRLQPTQISQVLRGQQRMELGLDEVRRSIDRLSEQILAYRQPVTPSGACAHGSEVTMAGSLSYRSSTMEPKLSSSVSPRMNNYSNSHSAIVSDSTDSGPAAFPTQQFRSVSQSAARDSSGEQQQQQHAQAGARPTGMVRTDSTLEAAALAHRRPHVTVAFEDSTTPGEEQRGGRVTTAAAAMAAASPAAGGGWRRSLNHPPVSSCVAHPVFENLAVAMARSNHAPVKNLLARGAMNRSTQFSLTTSTMSDAQHPRWGKSTRHFSGCVVHPASRFCSVLDGARALFLLNDVITIPYFLAWDVSLRGPVYFFSLVVATFWTLDLLFSFCTGYIVDGNVVLDWCSIAKQYLKRGFAVDLLAVGAEVIDIVASSLDQGDGGAPSSLQTFKVLRFFKITRLVRIIAKLRAGLLVRIRNAVSYFIQTHGFIGFEHTLNFAAVILKVLFVIAWLGHIGACIWYGLEQAVEATGCITWSTEDHYPFIHSYILGLYWSLSTMFSGASFYHPVNEPEAYFSVLWVVMGAIFVTSVTSTLAASLIDAQEKQQDVNKKIQTLTAFMAQQKAPILLSLAVQANFNEKLLAPKPITEMDLPFLIHLAPTLRAALREHQYSNGFLVLPFFRMLGAVHADVVQSLAFEASTPMMLRDGEEIFSSRQDMEHAILLSRGTMRYTFMPSGCFSPSSMRLESETLHENSNTDMPIQGVGGMRACAVKADAWICEFALFLNWITLGTLEAMGSQCGLLLVSSEQFAKVVTAVPLTAAVSASYAVQLAEVMQSLNKHNLVQYTDIDPVIDHDVVVSTMHVSIRGGIVSRSILELLRKQHRLHNLITNLSFGGKGLVDLEKEVLSGKSHLVIGPDGPSSISRVVRVVVLHLVNKDGDVCVQLAEFKDGVGSAKFVLPGCKVWGDETPEEAVTRLLDEELKLLADGIRIVRMEPTVEYGPSASYGLRTKYIKYIHTAELLGVFEKDSSLPGHVQANLQPAFGHMKSTTTERSQRSFRKVNTTQTRESSSRSLARSTGVNAASRVVNWMSGRSRACTPSTGGGDAVVQVMADLKATAFSTGQNRDDDSSYFSFAVVEAEVSHSSHLRTSEMSGDSECYQQTPGSAANASAGASPTLATPSPFAFSRGSLARAYHWMDVMDFELLNAQRAEVETELTPLVSSLAPHQWQRMLLWKLKLDSEERSLLEEEDEEDSAADKDDGSVVVGHNLPLLPEGVVSEVSLSAARSRAAETASPADSKASKGIYLDL